MIDYEKLKIEELSSSKECHECAMQRMKNGVCWSAQCSEKIQHLSLFCSTHAGSDEECQHESDGHCYPLRGTGKESKCKKCGEFYR